MLYINIKYFLEHVKETNVRTFASRNILPSTSKRPLSFVDYMGDTNSNKESDRMYN